MNMFRSKIGLALSAIYLFLFVLAGGFAIYLLVFHTADSALCGLPAIMVTLPWSMLTFPIVDALGYVTWYEKFAGTPVVYGIFAMLAFVPSALVNATIIYYIGTIFDKKINR